MIEVKDATIRMEGQTLATQLSFMAKDGELTCITGPQGSGKTTLLRTLLGFLPVSEGFVSVDGELLTVLSAHAFRRMMVYLPQQMQQLRHHLMPPEAVVPEPDDYTVWDVALPEPVYTDPATLLSPEEIFRLAEQTLRQSADKPVIIADEPAALFSPELTEQLLALLHDQVALGKTVLVASRRPDVIASASQVITLNSPVAKL